MFKLLFGLTPRWISDVEKNGKSAVALVLSDPNEILRGVGSYEGRDAWIDVKVQVLPVDDVPFEAKMQSRLSQALFGMLQPGMRVNVKYDPENKKRVLLVDDAQKLLSNRLKK